MPRNQPGRHGCGWHTSRHDPYWLAPGRQEIITAAAFVQVRAAPNWLVDNYARIAEWFASASRVEMAAGENIRHTKLLSGLLRRS